MICGLHKQTPLNKCTTPYPFLCLTHLTPFATPFFTHFTPLPIYFTHSKWWFVHSGRWGHSAVVHENGMFVFGGFTQRVVNELWRFDFGTFFSLFCIVEILT